MRRILIGATAALLLAGCASGPVQVGEDTWITETTDPWGWSTAASLRGGLYREAREHCAAMDKGMRILATSGQSASFGRNGEAEVAFQCIPRGVPETYTPLATTRLQVQAVD